MKGNSVSVKGNVTRDAEVRSTQGGRLVASWGIAWNSSRKTADGWEDVPHYFDVECWMSDKQARLVQPLIAKGAECAIVDGHLAFDSWQDRDGQKRSKVKVVVDDPINGLLLKPREGSQGGYEPRSSAPRGGYGPHGGYAEEQPPLSVYDADIPF